MSRHDISDEKWALIAPFLRQIEGKDPRGRKPKDGRLMFNGILWIMKTGAPWRDLLKEFGPWQTVYGRFMRWTALESWQTLLHTLTADADKEAAIIDASYAKVHQHGTGAKGGTSNRPLGEARVA